MTAPANETQRVDQLGALRRSWRLLLVGAVVSGAVALLVTTVLVSESYRSTATLIVAPVADPAAAERNRSLEAYLPEQSMTETFAQLSTQQVVVAAAARTLKVDQAALKASSSVRAVPRTPLLEITVSAPTAAEAARRTRGYVDEILRATREQDWVPALSLELVNQASTPTAPSSPQPVLASVVSAAAGLLLVACIVLLRTQLLAGRHRPSLVAPSAAPEETPEESRVAARTVGSRAYWA